MYLRRRIEVTGPEDGPRVARAGFVEEEAEGSNDANFRPGEPKLRISASLLLPVRLSV